MITEYLLNLSHEIPPLSEIESYFKSITYTQRLLGDCLVVLVGDNILRRMELASAFILADFDKKLTRLKQELSENYTEKTTTFN